MGIWFDTARLVIPALTPIAVAYFGWKVSKRLKEIDQHQWANRKLTEKRIAIYEDISPLINRLFCYFMYVGDWQIHTPISIVDVKRELDQKVHINKYLMEEEFYIKYEDFINAIFEQYTGPGRDAKLKTLIVSQNGDRSKSPKFAWDVKYEECFSHKTISSKSELHKLYDELMRQQRKGINA